LVWLGHSCSDNFEDMSRGWHQPVRDADWSLAIEHRGVVNEQLQHLVL